MEGRCRNLYIAFILCLIGVVSSVTDPNDAKILNDFRKGLENPEVLKWPKNGIDPCGPPSWPHVFCSNGRVTQIQVANLGIIGTLPQNFNQLTELYNLGLQRNHLNGKLPSFSGLSQLQFAYLDFNEFDTIPADFFHGLSSLRVLALDSNPFNASTGWSIPDELQNSVELTNFSCFSCNVAGPLPEFFGKLPSLNSLRLSYNRLTGPIPVSFRDSMLQVLWLNDQDGGGMNGTIDVIGTMVSLSQVWLHGNSFSGSLPDSIGDLTALRELNLNRNQLVGLVPTSLAKMDLELLDLNNNVLMGAIPKFRARNVTFSSNSFCQPIPGLQCSPEVNALLDFLRDLNYPLNLASQWSGNDPCKGPWLGLSCNSKGEVFVINLPRRKLNGTLSPSLQKLSSLTNIHLGGNNITGQVPSNLTELIFLRLLDISENNFQPPLPKFRDNVKVNADRNPLLAAPTIQGLPSQPDTSNLSPISHSPTSSRAFTGEKPKARTHTRLQAIILIAALGVSAIVVLAVGICCFLSFKKRKDMVTHPRGIVVHPRDPSDSDDMVKITVSSNTSRSLQSYSGSSSEGGNQVISAQLLQKVTNNFAPENELGRGGFGAVYKGDLDDGTKIAVKRMESGVVASKAVNEFQAEITVLSKVRHRHLVSLLGYSIEGKEKLLVYEYLPQGALSRHLFRWKCLNLEPLSWCRRLVIALDVARGLEYLHTLAQQSFIHRDLKSSNILLGDDFRAKVSDFGLVKLAPDRERSVATTLAGTFGYLAPEYAVTGKITTKADVFSYGVVLMELLTGLVALDEDRSEENRYLAEWFWKIKSNPEKLISAIDPALDTNDSVLQSIYIVAELAGHCTFRDPTHRPDMGYVVSVLSPLVDKWTPLDGETEECFSIDHHRVLDLPEMLKDWQEAEGGESMGSMSIEDLKSISGRPPGFADSFTSADAR